MNEDPSLSNADFLDLFKTQNRSTSGREFCWILGSGASRQSGIRMGRQITEDWLREMFTRVPEPKPQIEEWANEEFRDIPEFNYRRAVNFYPYVYHRRFHSDPSEGYAFLEKETERAVPSLGYTILAQIMAGPKHKVAVTTNFDDLLSNAVVVGAGMLPISCDADTLGIYSRLKPRRPIVAKLQSNLMVTSETDPTNLAKLERQWETPLKELFERYTPIVIGFGDSGGSGGTLMRFLKRLPALSNGIYWCHREKSPGALPDNEVRELVSKHSGRLVPILGFDEFMLQLWEKLLLVSPYNELDETHKRVAMHYRQQLSQLTEEITSLESDTTTETVQTTIKSAKVALERLLADTL